MTCSRHLHIGAILLVHVSLVVNRTSNSTPTETLQQHPLLFASNCTDPTFFLWRLHTARPSHPSHSATFLRSESPSSMHAKFHTVAARNNRDQSLYSCHLHIGAILRSHPVHREPHIHHHTDRKVATPYIKQGSHAVLKKYWIAKSVFIFQDLKVLNLAKFYIKYWKNMEILNGKEIRSIWAEFSWRQSRWLFMQCYAMCKVEFHDYEFLKWREVMTLIFLN